MVWVVVAAEVLLWTWVYRFERDARRRAKAQRDTLARMREGVE